MWFNFFELPLCTHAYECTKDNSTILTILEFGQKCTIMNYQLPMASHDVLQCISILYLIDRINHIDLVNVDDHLPLISMSMYSNITKAITFLCVSVSTLICFCIFNSVAISHGMLMYKYVRIVCTQIHRLNSENVRQTKQTNDINLSNKAKP